MIIKELQLSPKISVTVDDCANIRISYNKRTLDNGATATDFFLFFDHATFNTLANFVDDTVKEREQALDDDFFDRADYEYERSKDDYHEE